MLASVSSDPGGGGGGGGCSTEAQNWAELRKSPGLYARSLKLQGKVGEVKPDEIYATGRNGVDSKLRSYCKRV